MPELRIPRLRAPIIWTPDCAQMGDPYNLGAHNLGNRKIVNAQIADSQIADSQIVDHRIKSSHPNL